MIGTGVLRLGSAFNSGLIFTHILNILVAIVSFYSLKLFVLAASCYHESTFEEIWSSAFSRKTVFIPALCSILSSLSNIMSYLGYLQDSIINIISNFILLFDNEGHDLIDSIQKYKILFGFFIVIVLCLPASLSNDLRFIVITSYISITFFLCVFIYIIGRFAAIVVKDGFDPYHRFRLFDVKNHISDSISSLTYSYLFYPFAWPGLRHAKNTTARNFTNMFFTTILISFILYSIIGTFSYLSFFDQNTGGIILDYYPMGTGTNEILLIIGHMFTFLYILLTVPVVLNPARYILLNIINMKDSFPKDIWSLTGITLSLISLILANMPENITDILFIITDLLTLLLLFIFPPVLYLRGYGTKNKFHFAGAIFEMIIGLALISFMIYLDCTS